jgi:dual specificity phosphatase 12
VWAWRRLAGIVRRNATRHVIQRGRSLFARYVAGHDVDLIERGLYLGSAAAAKDISRLRAKGIGAVVTLLAQPDLAQADRLRKHGIRNLVIRTRDDDRQGLLQVLPEVVAFLDAARTEGTAVLVHCHAGMSRSAAVVTAILMMRHGLSAAEGLARVQACRPFINPGSGFRKQLSILESLAATEAGQGALADLLHAHVDDSLTLPEIVCQH